MSKRIMVIDDKPYLRDVQTLLLKHAGYTVTAAANGAEALGRLERERPDLILLDISMPGMDGHQFLHHLRAAHSWARLPVIVTTGHGEGSVAEPDVDILAKPFSETALMEHVRRLIGDA